MIKRGLKIKEEDYIKILRFLKNIAQNNLKKAKIEFEENLSSWRFELLTYFYKKVINDLEEIKKEIKRIPIVATMSAGKSTLINALVGIDLLPTKNQVCTSKIMEITHNPNLDYFVAYAERKDGEKLSIPLLNQKIIQKWNQDNDIEFIYLEGDVKILDASNKKIKLIDTPGVNSFKYQEHSKLTEEVLRRKDFENLVYVLNATQLTTTDDQSFLNKVVDIYKKRNINPNDIIFVLNKLDKFDLEAGEDIEETIKEAKDHLDNCGIKKAKIIPISAYAAFLFSKSLIEQSLSKKESLDFSFFYSIFAKEEYNLNAYFEQKSIKNNQIKSDGEINVAGNRFSKKNIFSRIDKTGILNLKNIIN
nr:dynamin family protein [Natroniella acetigena]